MRKMLVLAMLSILLLIVAVPLPASAAGGPKGTRTPRTHHVTTVRRTVRRTIRRTVRRTVRRSTRTSSQLGGRGVKLTATKKPY